MTQLPILRITRRDLNDKSEYTASDSLEFDGHIEIAANLGCVRFRGSIKASGWLRALAGTSVEAGLSIRCKQRLSVKLRIFAGLCLWRRPTPEEMVIEAAEIEGEVCFGTVRLLTEEEKKEASA